MEGERVESPGDVAQILEKAFRKFEAQGTSRHPLKWCAAPACPNVHDGSRDPQEPGSPATPAPHALAPT